MQMIEVRVGDKDYIERGKFVNTKSGTAKPLEHEQPRSKDWIDHHVGSAGLKKERGVADEGHAQLAWGGEHWTTCAPGATGHCRVSH
jgi:hypothetical protein